MNEILNQVLISSKQEVRRSRLFENGDIRLLVLFLVEETPKHAYEIIKQIGDLVSGGYNPSTGTIYPTLSYLENMKLIKVEKNDKERKQYKITLDGIDYLNKKRKLLDNILGRLEVRREIQNNDQYLDISRAMENLKTALRLKLKDSELSEEIIRKIAQSIDQAATDISYIKGRDL